MAMTKHWYGFFCEMETFTDVDAVRDVMLDIGLDKVADGISEKAKRIPREKNGGKLACAIIQLYEEDGKPVYFDIYDAYRVQGGRDELILISVDNFITVLKFIRAIRAGLWLTT